MSLAVSAVKGVNRLRKLVNSELFFVDSEASGSLDNNGAVTHLTGIAVGDTNSGRTGNSILLKSVMVRFFLAQTALATTPTSLVTVFLIQDKEQVADTTPSFGTIFPTPTATLEGLYGLNTQTGVGRYNVLRRWHLTLDSISNGSHSIEQYFEINEHVRYNGTASTDINKNGLYLYFLSNAPNTDAVKNTYKHVCRVSYHDN